MQAGFICPKCWKLFDRVVELNTTEHVSILWWNGLELKRQKVENRPLSYRIRFYCQHEADHYFACQVRYMRVGCFVILFSFLGFRVNQYLQHGYFAVIK